MGPNDSAMSPRWRSRNDGWLPFFEAARPASRAVRSVVIEMLPSTAEASRCERPLIDSTAGSPNWIEVSRGRSVAVAALAASGVAANPTTTAPGRIWSATGRTTA